MQKKKQQLCKHVPTMQDFIQSWELGVHHQLTASKNALRDCSPAEKAFYKDKVNTLSDVLSHLQGRGEVRMEDRALRDQNTNLKLALQMVTSGSKRMAANYRVQRKLNKDLNIQLNKQVQSAFKERQENKMLLHQMKAMRISCRDPHDAEKEWVGFPSSRKPTVDMLTTRLINQTETIAKLKVNLREVERKLDAQRQEASGALLIREKEWEERIERLERQLQSLEGSFSTRPKFLKQIFQSHV